MNKRLLCMLTLAVAALSFGPAQADGVAKAKRGGVVQSANDIAYELVMSCTARRGRRVPGLDLPTMARRTLSAWKPPRLRGNFDPCQKGAPG